MDVRPRIDNHRDKLVALAFAPILLLIATKGASPEIRDGVVSVAPAAAEGIAAAACWLTAHHVRGRARLVWRLFALSLACWAVTDLVAGTIAALGHEVPEVSLLDVGWLAFYPPMILALAITYGRLRPERGWQGALDSLTLVLGLGLPIWALVIAPEVRDSARLQDTLVNVAYPALDTLALGMVAWLVIRYGTKAPAWLVWITAALACQVVAGVVYAQSALADAAGIEAISAATYVLSAALWTMAARVRFTRPERYWSPGAQSLAPVWSGILPLLAAYAALVTAFAIGDAWAFAVAGVVSALAAVRLLLTLGINAQLIADRDRLMMTDPLTGAHNRRFLKEELSRSFARALRTGEPIALIAFDLDRFKEVNDGHGHGVGDVLLRTITTAVGGVIRLGDSLCRVGGDEFVLVTPDMNAEAVLEMAERVREAVTRAAAEVVPEIAVTASVGVALAPDGAVLPDDLLALADNALYAAKDAGRDCVRVAVIERAPDVGSPLPPRGRGAR